MKNFGLKDIKLAIEHWDFGRDAMTVLQPDGQWDQYVPHVEEIQNVYGYDPLACVTFATINMIEMHHRRLGTNLNFSDRFTAIMSKTREKGGNDPQSVCETVRNSGLVDESKLPLVDAVTFDDFYSPVPLSQDLVDLGNLWRNEYDFRHYWVFSPNDPVEVKVKRLKKALLYSPVAVSVCAWFYDNGVAVKPAGLSDGHFCVVYGINDDGTWKCLDSLDFSQKRIAPNYDFTYAKMCSVYPRKRAVASPFFGAIAGIIRKLCGR